MKKNGFTLVEILAVLVLVSVVAILSVPSIVNYISQSKNKISKVTEDLIFAGVDLYLDNNENQFPKILGNQYCATLKDIVDANVLQDPIVDSVSGNEISLNKFIKISYNYDNDLGVNNYSYELTDECEEIRNNTITVYGFTTEEIKLGDPINANNATKFKAIPSALGRDFYLKFVVENSIVKELHACIIVDEDEVCLGGGSEDYFGYAENPEDYTGNLLSLKKINDAGFNCVFDTDSAYCELSSNEGLNADYEGNVGVYNNDSDCIIEYGISSCRIHN